ncbi:MAG: hypothetical protein V1688_00505 [bacterium]
MNIYFFTNRTKSIRAHSMIIDWLKARQHEVEFELANTAQSKAVKVDGFDAVILEMCEKDDMIYKKVFDALMKSRPVLLLYEYRCRRPKDFDFPLEKKMLKYLTMRGYFNGNPEEVLEKFFVNLEKGPLERFNFLISKDIEDYLNWIPYSNAQTMSDFIRRLIKDEMNKDKKYGEYRTKTRKQ